MAVVITNRGAKLLLQWALTAVSYPTTFYVALLTNATAITETINTLSELTEIANGNGYTSGGIALARSGSGFTVTEDDANHLAKAVLADRVWTASGGPLPASGSGASQWALLTDEATVGNRQVIAGGGFASGATNVSVSDGQPLTLTLATLQLVQP